ncbi:MAG: FkbM family methyltransferase [Elusimicrobiota bacterium]|jgi:FkbM family methyltransferase|nr:FkbM family methyltransferase [Elusimicrobiota bacterium]
MKKILKKIFYLQDEGEYKKVVFFGFGIFHIFNGSSVSGQICRKVIRKIRAVFGFKTSHFAQKFNYEIDIYDNDLFKFRKFLSSDIKTAYLKLIENTDDESIRTVSLIISRLRKSLLKQNFTKISFEASAQEKAQIRNIKENFTDLIVKLSDKVIAYKQYLLPSGGGGFFENTFYYENFFSQPQMGGGGKNIFAKDIVDAGAFIGDSAIVFAHHTNKKIYSFEPDLKNFAVLLETIKLNGLEGKIIPINKALGDKKEKLNLAAEGAGTICFYGQEVGNQVEAVTLDDFVKENNLEVGIIKTDIEGFEQNLLRGAEQTIKSQKPILFISIYHNASDFFDIKPLIESWNLGYKFKIRKFSSRSLILETMLICEV